MTATDFGQLPAGQLDQFIAEHRLPAGFRELARTHFTLLAHWAGLKRDPGRTLFLGINGAQGTGKSTLADFLRVTLESVAGWRVACLSIDDFYLTRHERERLAQDIHPLLRTRGVPGTHDMAMLADCVQRLGELGRGETLALPRFDKATDDRAPVDSWPTITGPIDLIILEGWCVGSRPQTDAELQEPVNALEREQDADGSWRRFVNAQLAGDYAVLFAQLGALVFLQAPDFDAVYRWRLEQERKLPADAPAAMDDAQVAGFIQYFERLTRANLAHLPDIADAVLELDDDHRCARSSYRWPPGNGVRPR